MSFDGRDAACLASDVEGVFGWPVWPVWTRAEMEDLLNTKFVFSEWNLFESSLKTW